MGTRRSQGPSEGFSVFHGAPGGLKGIPEVHKGVSEGPMRVPRGFGGVPRWYHRCFRGSRESSIEHQERFRGFERGTRRLREESFMRFRRGSSRSFGRFLMSNGRFRGPQRVSRVLPESEGSQDRFEGLHKVQVRPWTSLNPTQAPLGSLEMLLK